MGIGMINTKIIALLILSILSSGCMTYKSVTNCYHLSNGAKVEIKASPVSVSGSDAEDSLNGNEGNLSLPLLP
jgi:hypothetical protein